MGIENAAICPVIESKCLFNWTEDTEWWDRLPIPAGHKVITISDLEVLFSLELREKICK